MISLQKQKVFIVFNRARAKAKQSPDANKILDRVYQALGIIQHHDYYQSEKALYQPTTHSCNCKDWEFHLAHRRQYTGPCKHMTAEILLERMSKICFHQLDFFDRLGV